MLKLSIPLSKIMSEVQALSDEAWNEFTATSPEGIYYIAEASVRGLMVTRMFFASASSWSILCSIYFATVLVLNSWGGNAARALTPAKLSTAKSRK